MLESTGGAKISIENSTVDGSVPYVEVRAESNFSRSLFERAQELGGTKRRPASSPGGAPARISIARPTSTTTSSTTTKANTN